jgi:uncharacterized protein YbaR (Trm112 family)
MSDGNNQLFDLVQACPTCRTTLTLLGRRVDNKRVWWCDRCETKFGEADLRLARATQIAHENTGIKMGFTIAAREAVSASEHSPDNHDLRRFAAQLQSMIPSASLFGDKERER